MVTTKVINLAKLFIFFFNIDTGGVFKSLRQFSHLMIYFSVLTVLLRTLLNLTRYVTIVESIVLTIMGQLHGKKSC